MQLYCKFKNDFNIANSLISLYFYTNNKITMHNTLEEKKEYRIWHPVTFNEEWAACDTSVLDDLSASWFRRRVVLEEKSLEYKQFLEELKREHAIETGVIEGLYDLKKGITETFIKEGFVQSFLSHGDTNIDENDLMNHLNDHLEAVDFVFDVVKQNRPLTTGFIKELHHLTTRHQDHAEGRDQFGNKLKIALLKGAFKVRENNPTRADGTSIKYCPPEQTASEMDNLVAIYNDLVEREVHPLIIGTWFHHSFVSIHPFQDGNGRVARLLTSLIFIKYGFFPITVRREEKVIRYFQGLREADVGKPQTLVDYFGEGQRRAIEKALNVKEITPMSLEDARKLLIQKAAELQVKKDDTAITAELSRNKLIVFQYCDEVLDEFRKTIKADLNGDAEIAVQKVYFDHENNRYFNGQIAQYTKEYNYEFDQKQPQAFFYYDIKLFNREEYAMGLSLHHYGYEESTMAMATFFELKYEGDVSKTFALKLPPYVFSLHGDIENKKKNIRKYLEKAMSSALAEIVNRMTK